MANIFKKALNNMASRYGYVSKAEFKSIALVNANKYGFGNQAISSKGTGIMKPSNVSFDTLRRIAKYDPVIRICVNTIKKYVSQAKWNIIAKEENKADDPIVKEHIKYATDLFTLQNKNNENMRLMLDRVLEDLLIIDAGVIEKVLDPFQNIVGLNSVDGATIRPVYNSIGELGEDVAYQQWINSKKLAEFSNKEMIYIMQNPASDVYSFGYGVSPIESILLSVQASLQADMYNARSFSEDNVPPGLLDLGDMSAEEAEKFIAIWNATVVNNTQKIKFVYGSASDKKYIPFQQSKKDMQFQEYIDWLTRIKLAAYGLTTLDANITQDVNRSTAEVQSEITNSRGVASTKQLLEEYFDREVLMAMGFDDVQFRFEKATNLEDKKTQADIDSINISSGITTPDEVRARDGKKPLTEEQKPVVPTKEEQKPAEENKKKSWFPPLY